MCPHILFTLLKFHVVLELVKDHVQTQSLSGLPLEVSSLKLSLYMCVIHILYVHITTCTQYSICNSIACNSLCTLVRSTLDVCEAHVHSAFG